MYTPGQIEPQDRQEVLNKRQERKAAAKAKKADAKEKIFAKQQAQLTPADDEKQLANATRKDKTPLSAIFLGPHAENFEIMEKFINEVMVDYVYWR